ncbi:MAG: nucleotidyltransferase domain-containing protein [Candidatus Methanomethyliaceae archaeon]|nr:nucleotidyltransferase domain-containing protein [Candidatus Methanomethyliaceae archaeon]MDW7971162.1 nucleotidyltransferase domain-containing protein [Nitrososphaerota archaeon]
MAKKISPVYEEKDVIYDKGRWELLRKLREKAIDIMKILAKSSIESIVHGSIARGDVNERSDIDVFIPYVIPSYMIENALSDFKFYKREITQATPNHVIKAIIHLDEKTRVTFPLIPLRDKEREFYKFGGEIGLRELEEGKRVPGVDKRLMVILPTSYGHHEFSALYNTIEASRIVGVSIELIMERIRVLTRRDEIGRTGVYFKAELNENENFEAKLKERIENDPNLRRLLLKRGIELAY